jgi:hypothetical protein
MKDDFFYVEMYGELGPANPSEYELPGFVDPVIFDNQNGPITGPKRMWDRNHPGLAL